jgi:hypothetical protein
LTAAIAVVAKSNVPSFALKFTCVEGPIGASDTPAIYTTLTDVTPLAAGGRRSAAVAQTPEASCLVIAVMKR